MDRQYPRTNGKSKPLQTNSHKEAYTYTLTKRKTDELIKVLTKDQDEKKEINYMGLSELMRMSIIFVTFCLN